MKDTLAFPLDQADAALADAINTEHERAYGKAREALAHARRCGELLLQAKEAVGHGEWLPWIAANCRFAARTAQRYIRLASNWGQLKDKCDMVSHLSAQDALRHLSEQANSLARLAPSVLRCVEQTYDSGESLFRVISGEQRKEQLSAVKERSREQERNGKRCGGKDVVYDDWTSPLLLLKAEAERMMNAEPKTVIRELQETTALYFLPCLPRHIADLLPDGVLAEMERRRSGMARELKERISALVEWAETNKRFIAAPLVVATEEVSDELNLLIARTWQSGDRLLDLRHGLVPVVRIEHSEVDCICGGGLPRGCKKLTEATA